MLIDSGSSISIVSQHFISTNFSNVSVEKIKLHADTANGSPLNFVGKIKLILTYENMEFEHNFFVSKDINYEEIIGMDL